MYMYRWSSQHYTPAKTQKQRAYEAILTERKVKNAKEKSRLYDYDTIKDYLEFSAAYHNTYPKSIMCRYQYYRWLTEWACWWGDNSSAVVFHIQARNALRSLRNSRTGRVIQ